MANYHFILSEDTISPGGWAQFMTGGANRLLFCIQGSIGLGELGALNTHDAICTTGNTNISTGHEGAMLWRWELFQSDEKIEDDVAGLTSRIIVDCQIELDALSEYVFRCETLGLPQQDNISQHLVLGPTITAALQGSIRLSRDGHLRQLSAGDAWFDDGTAPVKFSVEDDEPAVVVAVQILPAALKSAEGTRFLDGSKISDSDTKRFYKIPVDEVILV